MPPAEKLGTGSLPALGDHADEFVGRAVNLGGVIEFFVVEHGKGFDLAHDLAHVLDGVDDVAGAGFTLRPDHGSAFGDAAQGFAEVARAADEGRGEGVLVDVVGLVGGGEDLGLVDEVDADILQHLRLDEVADAGLGHDGMETAPMICLMSLGLAMRATPPSARIMAGTRSSAMTEMAPASSAMRACSTFITSMMTPPLSISARPSLRRSVEELKLPLWSRSDCRCEWGLPWVSSSRDAGLPALAHAVRENYSQTSV
jgi:hypothetical protein